jgi:glucosamine-6-phosphate deaminase
VAFNDPPADFETTAPYLVVSLDELCRRQQVGEGWFPSLESVPTQALSMSIRRVLASRTIVCSVPDRRKAEAVRASVEGPVTPTVPASILQTHPHCSLHLDREAASLLSDRQRGPAASA